MITFFEESGSHTIKEDYMEIYFFGIKNNYPHNGFRVCVPRVKEVLVCPVRAVERYMKVTEHLVAGRSTAPDFLTLYKPHSGLSVAGVAFVLNRAIELVGLKNQGFSAKCFRPTCATVAIEAGFDKDVVRTVCRWRSAETHYFKFSHVVLSFLKLSGY